LRSYSDNYNYVYYLVDSVILRLDKKLHFSPECVLAVYIIGLLMTECGQNYNNRLWGAIAIIIYPVFFTAIMLHNNIFIYYVDTK